jgi:hypothetical protein
MFINLGLAIYRLTIYIVCILGGQSLISNQVVCNEYIYANLIIFVVIAGMTVLDLIINIILSKLCGLNGLREIPLEPIIVKNDISDKNK